MRDFKWSQTEKAIARAAFDLALSREFEEIFREVKARAAKLQAKSDLWDLEHYLTRCRKQIDSKYDYRYSVLPMVLGILIRDGRLSENELNGLGEDKMDYIRRITSH